MYRLGVIIGMVYVWAFSTPTIYAEEFAEIKMAAAAPIADGNLDASREAAISEARKKIMLEVLKKRVPPDQQGSNAVSEAFLKNPDPYFARFAIENEEIAEGGKQYIIKAAADVRQDSVDATLVEKGLCDVFSAEPKPTVMILVSERFETRVTGTRTAETALAKAFQDKGLKVVDPEQRKLLDLRNKLFAESSGDMAAALQAATSFAADYLLYGQTAITSSSPLAGTDLKARFATVTLKLVQSSSAQVLATAAGEGNAKHVDELTGGNWALEAAAQKAADEVLKSLEKIFKENLLSGGEFVVDLTGLESEAQFQALQAAVKSDPNVTKIAPRFFFSGVGQLEITYKGIAGELAKLIIQGCPAGLELQQQEILTRYLRLSGSGTAQQPAVSLEEGLLQYNEEQYKSIDLEKAREENKALQEKVAALADSTKITDEQKKLLYTTQKELEHKEQQVGAAQSELELRKKELAAAETRKRDLENKKAAQKKQLDAAQNEQAAVGQAINQERENLNAQLSQAANAKEAAKTQLNQEMADLDSELNSANQQYYAASHNHKNAQSNAYMTGRDWVGVAQTSNSILRSITGGGFGLF
ncbi:MAG TPA: hypothetical protein PLI09_00605 [Candidatus Hydrogenedentes bacterium]|nr:hypothetical protein [Candidatus Hydrogenedentota bacterium]